MYQIYNKLSTTPICQLKHWNPHQVEGEDNFNPHKQGMTPIMGVSKNGRFPSALPGEELSHLIVLVTAWLLWSCVWAELISLVDI